MAIIQGRLYRAGISLKWFLLIQADDRPLSSSRHVSLLVEKSFNYDIGINGLSN